MDLVIFGCARGRLARRTYGSALADLDSIVTLMPRSRFAPIAANLAARVCHEELRNYDAALERYTAIVQSASAWSLPVGVRDAAESRAALLRESAATGYATIEMGRRLDEATGSDAAALACALIEQFPASRLADDAADRLCQFLMPPQHLTAEDGWKWRNLPPQEALEAWQLEAAARQSSGDTAWFLQFRLSRLLASEASYRDEAMRLCEAIEKGCQSNALRELAVRERAAILAQSAL
jgi:hypothetical protein